VIGVIFIVHGLSQGSVKRQRFDAYEERGQFLGTSEENVVDLAAVENRAVKSYGTPKVPERFDPDFIQRQIAKVQHSPNVISAYFNALEAQFRATVEMKILRKLKDYNELIASGIASEAKIYEAQKALEDAKVEQEISVDMEMKQLKKEDAKLALKESIAKRKSALGEGREEDVRSGRLSPEDFRSRKLGKLEVQADDMEALDAWRREELEKLDERMHEELDEVKDKPWSEEEKKKRVNQIKARYAKQREQVLTARF
jgi:hypothetical protein